MPESQPVLGPQKANMAAIMTVSMAVLALFGVGEMPAEQPLADALYSTAGLVMYGVATLLTAVVNWLTVYLTTNKPKKGTTLRSWALPILVLVALGLSACPSSEALTQQQAAYELANRFEAAQIVAEAAVTDPDVPPNVKEAIKTAEAVTRQAVLAYLEAAKTDNPNLSNYAGAATSFLADLIQILVDHGYMEPQAAAPVALEWRVA